MVLGFKARRSWRLVEVKACPVADPRIVAAIPALTQVAADMFRRLGMNMDFALSDWGTVIPIANIEIGKAVAERAKKAGVSDVVFDRNGFRYHGRVKAVADGAREGGLKF